MLTNALETDVLCVGHASYDLVFSVDKQPSADEKIFAQNLVSCGGGPAANAAVIVARLGYKAAFSGYLGNDLYGDRHFQELIEDQVNTDLIIRGQSPTPLSTVLVKPDGKRSLINYKGDTKTLSEGSIDYTLVQPKVILFDGHEPELSVKLNQWAKKQSITTILDAGSLNKGTSSLMHQVDYLVCSEKFATQYAGNPQVALSQLSKIAAIVIITLGADGIIWQRGQNTGSLPALPVNAIDTTGAGDAFHGAFAAAIAAEMEWRESLKYASVAGSHCCTYMGARVGLPNHEQLQIMIREFEHFLAVKTP